eukprot:GILI01002965.1.p1 GENE.GILI01002965.1~~GILI01002965.1.p1  ORF type:complete len:555 (-),score=60.75 GILI01002965.1:465-2042(-)
MKSLSERQALLHYERSWCLNENVEVCSNQFCKAKFSIPRRVFKHHCKYCGQIFCDKCVPVFPLVNGSPCSKHKFDEVRVCNSCRVPRIFRIYRHQMNGKLVGTAMDVILSFLDNRTINALLQTCRATKNEFHVPGVKAMGSVQERFPSLFNGAKVGSGLSGTVFTVEDRMRPDAGKVAVKVVKKSSVHSFYMWRKLIGEMKIQQETKHPNIIALYEVFQTLTELVMVMELGGAGSLRRVALNLRKLLLPSVAPNGQPSKLPTPRDGPNANSTPISPSASLGTMSGSQKMVTLESFVAMMLSQISSGLHYLHTEKNIAHRDIKLDNIVVSQDYTHFWIIDFGLAERFVDGAEFQDFVPCGTVGFASPENIRAAVEGRKKFSATREGIFAADMFSLGVVAFMILSGQKVFPSTRFSDQWKDCCIGLKARGKGWEYIADDAKKMVEWLLHSSAKNRAKPVDVAGHPYIRSKGDTCEALQIIRKEIVEHDNEEEENEWIFVGARGINLSDWGMIESEATDFAKTPNAKK